MRPFRLTAGVPAAVLVLAFVPLFFDCGLQARATDGETASRTGNQRLVGTTSREERTEKDPEGETLSASVPREDARGEPVPGLPRHPGSVRVGYSERRADGLALVSATYLAEGRPDAVRGFYRGVFRSGGWQVANVEYSGGAWHFLVLRGGTEAAVEVLPREGGSEVRIESSGPAAGAQEGIASAGGSKR
ncbi:hypothetical protein GBA63_20975 [Rubrobacter tropicus]|uniref:Uncharacterized protein n=1 Tax=Rubrobacter tropicus TaxID=2653851 RepID=A0A6G8QEB7_9ACTN|nr:hypothetical protein [Rubrobacter tropicus]QIN84840.1 hypothetical protein GBA63_20975 [Rubrobacter tropicus]